MRLLITNWIKRYFSDPQVVFLGGFLVVLLAVLLLAGRMMAPVVAAVIIAYLLEGLIAPLQRLAVPRLFAMLVIYLGFLLVVILILFGLLPLISKQSTQLIQQIPVMLAEGQAVLQRLPELYPEVISATQVSEIMAAIRTELMGWGQRVLSVTVASVLKLITVVIYLVLLPVLVFFMLKDKSLIVGWLQHFVPRNRQLAGRVWSEVDRQIGNYIRGKFLEVIIIWVVSYMVFLGFDLQYAMLLSVVVGLSVLVPYIGAAVVTVPVVVVALFQFGWSSDLAWLVAAYLVIQILDGNVLAPVLLSEVTDLHPVAIITAVLFFGGLWGLVGIFFAIPLATVVQAVVNAWPRPRDLEPSSGDLI
jgi:putative permease